MNRSSSCAPVAVARVATSVAIAILASTASLGCFRPSYPEGLACGAGTEPCPPGQRCFDGTCRASSPNDPIDASDDDAGSDHDGSIDDASVVDGAVELCANGWCKEVVPSTQHLSGIWGLGPDGMDLWAVGNNGTILHREPNGWVAPASGTGADLRDVWGFDLNTLFVVGSAGRIMRFTGTTWNVLPTVSSSTWHAIHGISPARAVVVGTAGASALWNGTGWSVGPNTESTNDLRGVAMDPDGVYLASGTMGQVSRCSTACAGRTIGTSILYDVHASEVQGFYVVTQNGDILYSALGDQFSNLQPGDGRELRAIHGNGAGNVWAFGNGVGYRLTSPSNIVPVTPPPIVVNDVFVATKAVFVVGNNGDIYRHDYTP